MSDDEGTVTQGTIIIKHGGPWGVSPEMVVQGDHDKGAVTGDTDTMTLAWGKRQEVMGHRQGGNDMNSETRTLTGTPARWTVSDSDTGL